MKFKGKQKNGNQILEGNLFKRERFGETVYFISKEHTLMLICMHEPTGDSLHPDDLEVITDTIEEVK